MVKKCFNCGHKINMYNRGKRCYACQEKEVEKITEQEGPDVHYNVKQMCKILGLESEESVRRLARKPGKLPPRVPGIKKWLWLRDVINEWIRSGHKLTPTILKKRRAILKATELGYPVGQMTLNGHDTQNLIDTLEEEGYNLDEDE